MRTTVKFFAIALIGGFVGAGIQFAVASWTPPPGSPPDGNVEPPLNVSGAQQIKDGNIGTHGRLFGDTLHVGDVGQGSDENMSIFAFENSVPFYLAHQTHGRASALLWGARLSDSMSGSLWSGGNTQFDTRIYQGGYNTHALSFGVNANNPRFLWHISSETAENEGSVDWQEMMELDQEALRVAHQIQIAGGDPGEGKVLTSDADGLARWQAMAAGGGAWISDLILLDYQTTEVVTIPSGSEFAIVHTDQRTREDDLFDHDQLENLAGKTAILPIGADKEWAWLPRDSDGVRHARMRVEWISDSSFEITHYFSNTHPLRNLPLRIYITAYGGSSGEGAVASSGLPDCDEGQTVVVNDDEWVCDDREAPVVVEGDSVYIQVSDTRPDGEDRDRILNDGWHTRPLNTVDSDEYNVISSLGDGRVTLPPGTYEFSGWATSGPRSGFHQLRLQDMTNDQTLAHGINMASRVYKSDYQHQGMTGIWGRFTLEEETSLELQHRIQRNQDLPWRNRTTWEGPEVYAVLQLWKRE